MERDKLIDHMFAALESPSKELTSGEELWIERFREQWEAYRSLSEKQFEILERIYAQKTD